MSYQVFQNLLNVRDRLLAEQATWQARDSEYRLTHPLMRAAYDELEAAFLKRFPKKEFRYQPGLEALGEVGQEIHNRHTEIQLRQFNALLDRIENVTAQLRTRADALDVPKTDTMLKWRESFASTWSTQGFGKNRYARGDAEYWADRARFLKLAVAVEEHMVSPGTGGLYCSGPSMRYEVLVGTTPLGIEILNYKSIDVPLREVVRMCWARQVNPRVYYPFLHHGYEQENGLDFFGGELDTPTTPAGSTS